MPKVNKLRKLPEKKRRQISSISTYNEKFKEMEHLLNSYHNNLPTPILSYAPIFLVTNIEVITKELIANLIDYGDTHFLSNSYKLLEQNTFSLEGLKLLQVKNITFGDIISNLISISSMSKIEYYMEKLLDKKLKTILSKETDENNVKFINNIGNNFRALHSLFECRHQLVHENSNLTVTFDEIKIYFYEVKKFLDAFVSYISKIVVIPNFQQGINEFLGKRNFSVEKRIKILIDRIVLGIPKDQNTNSDEKIKLLKSAYSTWKKFTKKIAEFECFEEQGGTIYSTLVSSCKMSFNELLLDELERRYSEYLEENSNNSHSKIS